MFYYNPENPDGSVLIELSQLQILKFIGEDHTIESEMDENLKHTPTYEMYIGIDREKAILAGIVSMYTNLWIKFL